MFLMTNIFVTCVIAFLIFRLPYVQGYYSEGRSIQVFVDADTLDQAWLLSELQNQTGQPPSKFHIRPCDEQDDM